MAEDGHKDPILPAQSMDRHYSLLIILWMEVRVFLKQRGYIHRLSHFLSIPLILLRARLAFQKLLLYWKVSEEQLMHIAESCPFE